MNSCSLKGPPKVHYECQNWVGTDIWPSGLCNNRTWKMGQNNNWQRMGRHSKLKEERKLGELDKFKQMDNSSSTTKSMRVCKGAAIAKTTKRKMSRASLTFTSLMHIANNFSAPSLYILYIWELMDLFSISHFISKCYF